MNAEGVRLFVGSYGPADHPTIHVCNFDRSSGELIEIGGASGIRHPSFVAVTTSGRHLYAVSETGLASDGVAGSVHAFRVAGDRSGSVELVPLNRRPSGGDHPCHLRIDPTGTWVAVANYGSGSIAVLPIGPDGALGDPAAVVEHHGAGPNPARQAGPHAHATIFSPDGRFLIAADLGIDRLVVGSFDRRTGAVRPHGEAVTAPGAGPRHLAFHPSGYLLVVNELDNTLTIHEWDGDAGAIGDPVTTSTLPPGAPESIAADIRISADGRHVYVSNRGHDSIAVFEVDGGRSNRLGVRPCGGAWPRGLRLAPGGDHLLVANERSDSVAVLPLIDGGADLGEPVARLAISRPTCVAVADRIG